MQAETPAEVAKARKLFEEYAAWVAIDLCFQNFDRELAELPGRYGQEQRGRLLLAVDDQGDAAGCVALRDLGDGVCEMKRLFVRTRFQGRGLGKILTEKIIMEGRALGYERMRLDTLPSRMGHAIQLYRALGFREIEPYYHNPTPATLYMELVL